MQADIQHTKSDSNFPNAGELMFLQNTVLYALGIIRNYTKFCLRLDAWWSWQ